MYKTINYKIKHEKREEINKKILFGINKKIHLPGFTKELVFNSFSGKGNLHNLKMNDFNNYNEFSNEKKIIELGQFFTPNSIIENALYNIVKPHSKIADFTSGIGAIANICKYHKNVYLNEIDEENFTVCKYLFPETNLSNLDIRNFYTNEKFDIVFGNPPFNLYWDGELSQFFYCKKASETLKAGGIFILLVPETFLEDEFYNKSKIDFINENFNFICQYKLDENTFKNKYGIKFKTKIMYFQKKSNHFSENNFKNEYVEFENKETFYNKYLSPIFSTIEERKSLISLENKKQNNDDFNFKATKYLYDIKRNSKISHYYENAVNFYNEYLSSKSQKNRDLEKEKVIKYLKSIFKMQNPKRPTHNEIKLVKIGNKFIYKAYSPNAQLNAINLNKNLKNNDINYIVSNSLFPEEFKEFHKLLRKKNNLFLNQTKKIDELKINSSIEKYLNDLTFISTETIIKLNDRQKNDMNLFLQKRYSICQWEMGTGKTIAALSYSKYHLDNKNVKNVFITGPAIATKGNFLDVLKSFNLNFVLVENVNDFKKIKQGDIILMTAHSLIKLQKQVKNYNKKINNKIAWIFDEAHTGNNINSLLYKASRNCFVKAKYKFFTTGTATSNNISELFALLDLLYNNSYNFISNSKYYFSYSKKEQTIAKQDNPFYKLAFPTYKEGLSIFKKCFAPIKKTVFGAEKNTQDIYNSFNIKTIRDYTIINRSFFEIVGEELKVNHQINIEFSNDEKLLYNDIISEFHKFKNLFTYSNNSRKDSMLDIINQMTLLIKTCSLPHLYTTLQNKYSNKFFKVKGMLEQINEKVVIGCKFKNSVLEYKKFLADVFPNRKIITITGSDSLKKRKKKINAIKEDKDTILIATQDSLSCSLNINFINKVFIVELPWNFPKLDQFTARFIRMGTKEKKDLYYFTYNNSIEMNIMQLLINKEKINQFLKSNNTSNEILYKKLGIEFDIMNMLLKKEVDENGKLRIKTNQIFYA